MSLGTQGRSSIKPVDEDYCEVAGGAYAIGGVTLTLPYKRVLAVTDIISPNANQLVLAVRTITPNQVRIVAIDISELPTFGNTKELAALTALGTLGMKVLLPSG